MGFVLSIYIAFGVAFQVPIVVMLLVRFELVTIEKLRSFRGYFIVLAFIVAAVLTPPDVVSQLALAIPMCLLYEVGIVGARYFTSTASRRKKAPTRRSPEPPAQAALSRRCSVRARTGAFGAAGPVSRPVPACRCRAEAQRVAGPA